MAVVVAFVPDLLFGSNVAGAVAATGHECRLLAAPSAADLAAADGLIVDLTDRCPSPPRGRRDLQSQRGLPTLAFYSHVEADVRTAALAAGIGLVRSAFADGTGGAVPGDAVARGPLAQGKRPEVKRVSNICETSGTRATIPNLASQRAHLRSSGSCSEP